MSNFHRTAGNVAVNTELVTRAEVVGDDVRLYSGTGHVHTVHYDSHGEALKALDELTGSKAPVKK